MGIQQGVILFVYRLKKQNLGQIKYAEYYISRCKSKRWWENYPIIPPYQEGNIYNMTTTFQIVPEVYWNKIDSNNKTVITK